MNIKELLDNTDDKYIPFKNIVINPDRATGNTTRSIDSAIQILFTEGKVLLLDHWEEGTNRDASIYFRDAVINRLLNEHPGAFTHNKNSLSSNLFWLTVNYTNQGVKYFHLTNK